MSERKARKRGKRERKDRKKNRGKIKEMVTNDHEDT